MTRDQAERVQRLQGIYDRLMAEQTSRLTADEYAYICSQVEVPIGIQNGDDGLLEEWFVDRWDEWEARRQAIAKLSDKPSWEEPC